MSLSTRSAGLLRALIYPVQFDDDPVQSIDRVLRVVVEARALDADAHDYLGAIRAGMASGEMLCQLIPQNHSEAAIRRFLEHLAKRLENRTKMTN